MRISDWSSYVCSSDLNASRIPPEPVGSSSRESGSIKKIRQIVVSVTARHLTLVASNTARPSRTGLCITFAMRIYPYEVVQRHSHLRARPRNRSRAVFAAGRATPRRADALHTDGQCAGLLA